MAYRLGLCAALLLAIALLGGTSSASATGGNSAGSTTVCAPSCHAATTAAQTAVSPDDVVTCSFVSYDPIRLPSQDKIEGNGSITGCAPHDPTTCRIETDIQYFNSNPMFDDWETYAGGAGHYGPPCQGLSGPVSATCDDHATAIKYRDRTIVTITESGDTESQHTYSTTVSFKCFG
ncbi:MAG: hypothetical protein ACRDPG_07555 [Nocardioidaceae bacterium]